MIYRTKEEMEQRFNNPERYLIGTGLEDVEFEYSFDNFEKREKSIVELGLLKEYPYRETLNNILIQGQCGNGKTHICAAIMRELIKRGCTPSKMHYFIESAMHRLLVKHAGVGINFEYHYNKITNYELLIIDDLGRKTPTLTGCGYTTDIIDDRQRKIKTTIITTNKTFNQLLEIYGEPLVDRLKNYELITINLTSYRGKVLF